MAEEGMDLGWGLWMRHIGYDRGKEHGVGSTMKQCNSAFACAEPALFYLQITQKKCVDTSFSSLLTAAII